ncbi:hypothetical protein Bbelb_353470 [Branchiostoma belcheri]|nr:hypothetical protein Bbelb_353470 [Branchiostoma belcheri]
MACPIRFIPRIEKCRVLGVQVCRHGHIKHIPGDSTSQYPSSPCADVNPRYRRSTHTRHGTNEDTCTLHVMLLVRVCPERSVFMFSEAWWRQNLPARTLCSVPDVCRPVSGRTAQLIYGTLLSDKDHLFYHSLVTILSTQRTTRYGTETSTTEGTLFQEHPGVLSTDVWFGHRVYKNNRPKATTNIDCNYEKCKTFVLVTTAARVAGTARGPGYKSRTPVPTHLPLRALGYEIAAMQITATVRDRGLGCDAHPDIELSMHNQYISLMRVFDDCHIDMIVLEAAVAPYVQQPLVILWPSSFPGKSRIVRDDGSAAVLVRTGNQQTSTVKDSEQWVGLISVTNNGKRTRKLPYDESFPEEYGAYCSVCDDAPGTWGCALPTISGPLCFVTEAIVSSPAQLQGAAPVSTPIDRLTGSVIE